MTGCKSNDGASYHVNLVNPVPGEDIGLSLVRIILRIGSHGDVAAAEAELAEFVL